MMKKILALLAVATIPATLSGCAACWPTAGLCPFCPCNCFNRPAACPPAPAYCPPAPMYAAPLAANTCPPPCAPMASQMMPQYVMPTSAPYGMPYGAAPGCNTCQQMAPQAMYAQPAYYTEQGCGYVEPGCGEPFMGNVGYGPSMPFEGGGCESGCCGDGGAPLSAPMPQAIAPAPGE